MTTGMTTPTLHTAAAAAGGGMRMFGLPWWLPLVLLVLISMTSVLAVSLLHRRYAQAVGALSVVVLLSCALFAPSAVHDFLMHLPWIGPVG